MMDYKVLVTLFVPEIEKSFELYIPVNKTVSFVLKLLNSIVKESMYDNYPIKEVVHLCNRRTGEFYKYEDYVRDTDIRNGTQLVMF